MRISHWSSDVCSSDLLDFTGEPRDFDAVFGRDAKRVLEIGFGNGEALRFSAARDRERDHIGIEVHAPGVGRLLNALDEDGLDHVRLYHHAAVDRKSVVSGKSVSVRVYLGGRRKLKKKTKKES